MYDILWGFALCIKLNALILECNYCLAMKKNILYIFILVWCSSIQAQNQIPWKRIDQGSSPSFDNKTNGSGSNKQVLFRLDQEMFMQSLATVSSKTQKERRVEINIPNISGAMEKFLVWESSNLEPELQAKYPDIRAYSGIGLTDTKS